ncbi:MAG TPA: hypothetical protein VL574_00745 [Stellaceae bacterium]|jgi:hypothetical protein|nr:hypothetical protein [Stellaceae bacterium]
MRRTNQFVALAIVAAGTLAASAAIAAPTPDRIRGTVSAVSSGSVTVHTTDGKDVSVALTTKTGYLNVLPSSLDKVESGSYIGTATKTVGGKLIALEVVVFPPEMKGTGDGHYAWDKIPDTTLSGKSTTSSSMTNGSVTAVQAPGQKVNSSMTNGSVTTASSSGGAKQITVTYKGGKQSVLVPPTAPIVTFKKTTMSDLTVGKTVFVRGLDDGGKVTAQGVVIGTKGANPPM